MGSQQKPIDSYLNKTCEPAPRHDKRRNVEMEFSPLKPDQSAQSISSDASQLITSDASKMKDRLDLESLRDSVETDIPQNIDPWIGKMLKSILVVGCDTAASSDTAHTRLRAVELEVKGNASEMEFMRQEMKDMQGSIKTLSGRLIRAEKDVQHLREHNNDLTARSMRDNIIIKTVGNSYRQKEHEDTEFVIREFLRKEMKVPNTENITILRSHRLGQAGDGEHNSPLIAKIPFQSDIHRIFNNVQSLKGTEHSINIQIPADYNERRQYSWPEYKKAKQAKKPATFKQGQLFVNNKPVTKLNPIPIPSSSSDSMGNISSELLSGTSGCVESQGHMFQARAIKADCTQDVRDALDELLQDDGFAHADFISHAYRFEDDTGGKTEDFESGGNSYAGWHHLQYLRKEELTDTLCFVACSSQPSARPLRTKAKNEHYEMVLKEAVASLMTAVKAAERKDGKHDGDE